jgi:hypothetical protein
MDHVEIVLRIVRHVQQVQIALLVTEHYSCSIMLVVQLIVLLDIMGILVLERVSPALSLIA